MSLFRDATGKLSWQRIAGTPIAASAIVLAFYVHQVDAWAAVTCMALAATCLGIKAVQSFAEARMK